MSALDSAAEIQKLAYGLGVPPERLAALATVAPEDLRALRKQLSEALFQADKVHFAKVAALSRAVPVSLAAKIAESVLPPLIGARAAELLDQGWPERLGPWRVKQLRRRRPYLWPALPPLCLPSLRPPSRPGATPRATASNWASTISPFGVGAGRGVNWWIMPPG